MIDLRKDLFRLGNFSDSDLRDAVYQLNIIINETEVEPIVLLYLRDEMINILLETKKNEK